MIILKVVPWYSLRLVCIAGYCLKFTFNKLLHDYAAFKIENDNHHHTRKQMH